MLARGCWSALSIGFLLAACSGDDHAGNTANGGSAGNATAGGAGVGHGGAANGGAANAAGVAGVPTAGTFPSGGNAGTGALGGDTTAGGSSSGGGDTRSGGSFNDTGGSANGGHIGTSGAAGAGAGGASFGGMNSAGANAGGTASGASGLGGSNNGGSNNGGSNASGGYASGGYASGGSTNAGDVNFTWDFASDAQGWVGDFCDYPPANGSEYSLGFAWAKLPSELGTGNGLRMTGNNHSDDLFMFIARRVGGLKPNAQYSLDVRVEIGTNAPADCGGIGGSPGLSVYFKIGASPISPAATADNLGWLRLNLDKGNQSVGGADLKLVGNISNTLECPGSTYQKKELALLGFPVRSASDGSVAIILGTDSGFEGVTTLYYDRIQATLHPAN